MFKMFLGQKTVNKPVMAIRTGGPIATAYSAIINPNNLKIEGWFVKDHAGRQLIMLGQDVREIIPQGFIVNDHEVFSSSDDLIRLRPVIDLKFELFGLPVETDSGKKLGKVTDYAFDNDAFMIQKIYTEKSMFKSISGDSRIVDRSQIVEITRKRIVVKDASILDKTVATVPAAV